MSNDLISRSALIDELKQSGMIVDDDYGNAMVDFINSLPTAYDADVVVEQLEERLCSETIEIVKAGGVSDNH